MAGSGKRWQRLANELHCDAATAQALDHCGQYGHGWKPLKMCNPGDSDWCHHCGSHRTIAADGTVTIERPT